jgi:hypothetical protein
MGYLHVTNYNKMKLNPKQIKWLKNNFKTTRLTMSEMLQLEIFEDATKQDVERFIRN